MQFLKISDKVKHAPSEDLGVLGTIVGSQCFNDEVLFRVRWDNGKLHWINEVNLVLA
jgi:hypothetical protein